jgi:serine/threonine protein kinase
VKIFDFGLAKEVNPNFADQDGVYQLTAMTGSLRYMAPEVLLGKRYNETADVYSLSILLWQLLSLKTPYDVYLKESTFRERMGYMGKRPSINVEWPAEIRYLLKRGWSSQAVDRPTMGYMSLALKYELDQYSLEETIDFVQPFDLHLDTDDFDDDDVSRKSEISYRRLVEPSPLSIMTEPHHHNSVVAAVQQQQRRR